MLQIDNKTRQICIRALLHRVLDHAAHFAAYTPENATPAATASARGLIECCSALTSLKHGAPVHPDTLQHASSILDARNHAQAR